MSTELAKRQTTLKTTLQNAHTQISMVLPKHLTADRLIKVALVACSRNPKLLECSQESVLQSVMTAAQLGLDCGGVLGSAYLVPYKNHGRYECQLIVGYRGLIDLARRSGEIRSIEARPVYDGDEFEMSWGLEPVLRHKPNFRQPPNADKLLGVYVVANFKDGGSHTEWMSKVEIDAIRNRSKAGQNGPWVTDYIEMAKKTVVRRASKYWPLSPEAADHLIGEDRVDLSATPLSLEEHLGEAEVEDGNTNSDRGEEVLRKISAGNEVVADADGVASPAEEKPEPTEDISADDAEAVLAMEKDDGDIALTRLAEIVELVLNRTEDVDWDTAEDMVVKWLEEKGKGLADLRDNDLYKMRMNGAARTKWDARVPSAA